MSPTIFRVKGLRFFFFSREELRMHVYVLGKDGEAKIWMEPTIELVRNDGLSWAQLTVALCLVEERQDEICEAWRQHFRR
tara:strand:+ start:98 stop:337 length:240 start_codon:yes stop_codon:yes gene_type:complete